MNETLRIILYGLVAATSPLALGATLVVLTSGRGRVNGCSFAIGVLVGQTLIIVLLLVLGSAWVPPDAEHHEVLRALIDLAFGAGLLAAALHVRHSPQAVFPRRGPPGPRTEAIRGRLARLRPITAFGTGALLGIGGPKRLGVTVLAAATVAATDPSEQTKVLLALVYVLLATVLVWAPVLLYLVFDHRATDWLRDRQTWIRAHEQPLVFWPSLVLGAGLTVTGVVQLATG